MTCWCVISFHHTICGAVCFQFTHSPCDDWENIYTLSYYHHQIESMSYYPLFRVRSWNNGVRCMSFYILIKIMSYNKLEQLERMRSKDTPAASWLPTLFSHVGSQVKTRSNDFEDIGQGQRSSHATHLLMLVIICTKYGKKPSRTVDATERTRFSRSRLNGLENIGQGQRSFHATHPLMLMMICAKYGKNASRIVDFYSRWKPKN